MSQMPKWLVGIVLLARVLVGHAQSTNPLPPETVLVGAAGTPQATTETFTISAAEDLVVTLTDLQVPAALSSATVVVSQGSSITGDATLAAPATTATFAIPAATGEYTLQVFGEPNASFSVGTFTVCVAPKSSPSDCIQSASLAGNISAPGSASNPTVSTVSAPLTVTTAGTYTVTFADDQFPTALQTAPNLAIFQGSQPIALAIASGTALSLSPGNYTLLSIAQASQSSQAGLYGIVITGPSGTAPLLNSTYPVGSLAPAVQASNPTSQTLTLGVTDFQFPAALATGTALATSGGTVLGTASLSVPPGTSSFTVPAGAVQVWSYAAAGASAGTYQLTLTGGAGTLLQTAAAVSTASELAFAYVTAPLAAGSYQATATDFQFPAVLPTLQFAIAQGGTILEQASTASSVKFNAAAGPAIVLVAAAPPASGNGLFDVNVQTTGASPQLDFDKTQAVGVSSLFTTQTINLGVSGNYTVTLTDLKFPAQFADLDLVVSSGGTVIGKIIGGGSFPIAATPGAYLLSFIATPAAGQKYGMYGLQIVNATPTVTLSASPTSVSAGGTTTLTWTSTNATSCTGTGTGFTGSQATNSGTLAVSVASTTTFSLSCTGAGGTATKSVTVSATAASSHSGGGAMDFGLLSLLGLGAALRARAANKRTALTVSSRESETSCKD
jgi:hypothetical protein